MYEKCVYGDHVDGKNDCHGPAYVWPLWKSQWKRLLVHQSHVRVLLPLRCGLAILRLFKPIRLVLLIRRDQLSVRDHAFPSWRVTSAFDAYHRTKSATRIAQFLIDIQCQGNVKVLSSHTSIDATVVVACRRGRDAKYHPSHPGRRSSTPKCLSWCMANVVS